jgi:hypothetical protein
MKAQKKAENSKSNDKANKDNSENDTKPKTRTAAKSKPKTSTSKRSKASEGATENTNSEALEPKTVSKKKRKANKEATQDASVDPAPESAIEAEASHQPEADEHEPALEHAHEAAVPDQPETNANAKPARRRAASANPPKKRKKQIQDTENAEPAQDAPAPPPARRYTKKAAPADEMKAPAAPEKKGKGKTAKVKKAPGPRSNPSKKPASKAAKKDRVPQAASNFPNALGFQNGETKMFNADALTFLRCPISHSLSPIFSKLPMKDRKKRIAHTDETKAIKKDVETANAALLEGGFKIMVYWSRKAVALCVLVPSVKLSAQKKWRQALGWWV